MAEKRSEHGIPWASVWFEGFEIFLDIQSQFSV